MPRPLEHVPPTEAKAIFLSLAAGVILLVLKFVAYVFTSSAAVYSDALESTVNVAAAIFAAYALHVAHTPADASHPYGHGKIEFLSAAFEGGMILLAGLFAGVKAIGDLVHPALQADHLDVGLALMATALVVNGVLGWYLVQTGKRHRSLTLEADGHHLLGDAVTSVAAASGLLLVRVMHWPLADPIAALLVSAYIVWVGFRLIARASAGLMDKQDLDDEVLLRQILDAHVGPDGAEPHICSYHKLRHRHSGRYHWVEFHMVVPRDWNVDRGHRIASAIEDEIESALGEGNATAHVEPCHGHACPACAACAAQPAPDADAVAVVNRDA